MGASTAAAVAGVASAAVSIGTNVYNASKSKSASQQATNSTQNAADYASQVQWEMFDQMREDLAPYRTAGQNFLSTLGSNLDLGEAKANNAIADWQSYVKNNRPGVFAGITGVEDPSLAFVQSEAQKAVERGAASRYGALSGATQQALQNRAGDVASTYWQNAYQNALGKYNANLAGYNTTASGLGNVYNAYAGRYQNYLQNLLSAAGMGQNAAAMTGSAGIQTGNALAQNRLLSGLAAANNAVSQGNASGQQANAIGSGLSSMIGQISGMNWGGGGGGVSSYSPYSPSYDANNWGYNSFGGGY